MFESWILSAYLEVQNLYFHRNPAGIAYTPDYKEQRMITFLPFLPFVGVTAEF